MLTDIALDAMGSDKSPEPELRGAILACRQLPVRVHLVGSEDVLRRALPYALDGERLPIHIVHASEHIGMDEKAANAVLSKRDSSMRVGLKLVRERKRFESQERRRHVQRRRQRDGAHRRALAGLIGEIERVVKLDLVRRSRARVKQSVQSRCEWNRISRSLRTWPP